MAGEFVSVRGWGESKLYSLDMNVAIDFSQFAYRPTKTRLTLYEHRDKENLPLSPEASRRSPTPNNATPIPSPRGARDTLRGGNERLPVVPETPDEERSSSCGRKRRRMRPAADRERRKRQRLSSSSSSETETESRDAERVGGARGSGGLFGSLHVSKRRKRSVELSLFEYRPNCKSPPNVRRSEENHKEETTGDESSKDTDSPSSDSKPECRAILTLESDSASECEEYKRRGVTPPRPLPCDDGWLTCRRKPGKAQQMAHSLTTSSSNNCRKGRRRKTGGTGERMEGKLGGRREGRPGESKAGGMRPGDSREMQCLRQLFPQYSDVFLRGRLRESTGMDEAVASILASDGKFTLHWPFNLYT